MKLETNAPVWEANRVRALREKAGMSQEQLAKKMNLCLRTIKRHEAGETDPYPIVKRAYAATFKCQISEVFP